MGSIRVTSEFGVVIRRDSLRERGVSLDAVLDAMETLAPIDEDDRLLSFGPSFGQEALDEFVNRLSGIGLHYFDDFFELVADYPSWCELRVSCRPQGSDVG